MGGICVSPDTLMVIEEELNNISNDVFGSDTLVPGNEFHGVDICQNKGNMKGRSFIERENILRRILNIFSREDVYRLYVRIIPENITHTQKPVEEIAFMFLVEDVDRDRKSVV